MAFSGCSSQTATPGDIKPKRTYARRTRYFAKGELSRLVLEALRDAGNPLSTDDPAGQVVAAKGFDAADSVLRVAVRDQALTALRAFRTRGADEQIGLRRALRWKLAHLEPD